MAKTIHERLVAALIADGAVKERENGKSIVFVHPARFPDKRIYLGKSTSLRIGVNKATSVPANRWKMRLLETQNG